MNKIVITTDSGIDPIHEETMIPGQIVENEIKSYQDMKEITPEEILEKIKTGSNFKTSSPMIGDYEKIFIPYLEDQYDIIHLFHLKDKSIKHEPKNKCIPDWFGVNSYNVPFLFESKGTLDRRIQTNTIEHAKYDKLNLIKK